MEFVAASPRLPLKSLRTSRRRPFDSDRQAIDHNLVGHPRRDSEKKRKGTKVSPSRISRLRPLERIGNSSEISGI